jgi:hypothetical protein
MAIGIDQSEHRSRAGESQSLFRDVNNRIKSLNELRSGWSTISEWVCECANEHCTECIEMTVDEFAELRSNPTHFAVVADNSHVAAAERVVARHERYWVVEKQGEAADLRARNSRVP